MTSDYKCQTNNISGSNQYLMFEEAALNEGSSDESLDRSSFYFNSIIHEIKTNIEDEEIDISTVSNLLDILCNSYDNKSFDITILFNLTFCSFLIEHFQDSPEHISKIFSNILLCSSLYDDLFLAQRQILFDITNKFQNDNLTNNMISIIATISSRHPQLMTEFISLLYTKKITVDIARYIYNIIPIAQQTIKKTDDYNKIAHLISQIIICNDIDVILFGIRILTLAIKCNDKFLLHSFGQSQIQYESLLYNNEIKKIAAGYNALTITMPFIKNRNECIKNATNILQMAEKHIKLIPNIIKQSIIQYVCQYSIITKICISQNLFEEILQLAENGAYFIRSEAVNCIAISIIESKRKIDDISLLVDIFASHLGGESEVVLNIIKALNIIFDYAQTENKINSFCLIVLSNLNFDELIHNDYEEIREASQHFLRKIGEV